MKAGTRRDSLVSRVLLFAPMDDMREVECGDSEERSGGVCEVLSNCEAAHCAGGGWLVERVKGIIFVAYKWLGMVWRRIKVGIALFSHHWYCECWCLWACLYPREMFVR